MPDEDGLGESPAILYHPFMSGTKSIAEKVSRGRLIPASFLTLAAVSVVAYLPVLGNGFLSWDDHLYVTENPLIRTLNAEFFRRVFTEPVASNYHPLTVISHALDYAVWGLNPMGHHLTNVLLHGLNTSLVFLLLIRLFPVTGEFWWRSRELWAAVFAALLFGLHPVHVESVAWVSGRKDLLYAVFYLLAVLAYMGYARTGRRGGYAASLLWFVFSLLSKPMAVTLPLVMLILDGYPLGRLKRDAEGGRPLRGPLIEKIPFALLGLVFSLTTLWAQQKNFMDIPFLLRLQHAVYASFFYLGKLVWPVDLAPYYPYPDPSVSRLAVSTGMMIAASVSFITLSAALWTARKTRPGLIAVWGLYLVQLIPVLGIVQVGGQFAADRYLYLAGLPVFYFFCRLLADWGRGRAFGSRVLLLVLAAVAVVFLAGATWRQSRFWKDMITLWDREIRIYPDGVPLAYLNRGNGYFEAGAYAEAVRDFSRAIEIHPGYVKALVNRGNAFMKQGADEEAIADFTRAIEAGAGSPEISRAFNNRGGLLMKRGDSAGGLRDFSRAIEHDGENVQAWQNRGRALLMAGAYDEAVPDLSRALDLSPESADTHADLAEAYRALGRQDQAAFHYREAERLGRRPGAAP